MDMWFAAKQTSSLSQSIHTGGRSLPCTASLSCTRCIWRL